MDESAVARDMGHALDTLTRDISSLRTGRATPSLISDLEVAVYGGAQKLKIMELANISVQDSQTIIIDPWDKSITGEVRKGILAANIGLNPIVDQEVLRISLPPLTSEDREKMIKLLSQKLEAARIMVRQIRAGYMKDIKENFEKKEISEDERFAQEKRLQQITDEFVAKINEAGSKKEADLRAV